MPDSTWGTTLIERVSAAVPEATPTLVRDLVRRAKHAAQADGTALTAASIADYLYELVPAQTRH